MSDKEWIIDFKLMQLSASHYFHSTKVKAANLGLAINRAWAEVKKRPAVKGRRITKGTITFEMVGKGEE